MSVFFNMLGIQIESYEHVLGPPRVSSDYEKIFFSHKIMPFFNGLIKKNQSVIKVGFGVRFWCGDARFHTQSVLFTPEATFLIIRAVGTPRGALFN